MTYLRKQKTGKLFSVIQPRSSLLRVDLENLMTPTTTWNTSVWKKPFIARVNFQTWGLFIIEELELYLKVMPRILESDRAYDNLSTFYQVFPTCTVPLHRNIYGRQTNGCPRLMALEVRAILDPPMTRTGDWWYQGTLQAGNLWRPLRMEKGYYRFELTHSNSSSVSFQLHRVAWSPVWALWPLSGCHKF